MIVRIGKDNVDVLDHACPTRSCYRLGFDKGPYTLGRGYTSYYKTARPVCETRHLHGCPTVAICPQCQTQQVEGVSTCQRCWVTVIPYVRPAGLLRPGSRT